jgi:hypothetical protein
MWCSTPLVRFNHFNKIIILKKGYSQASESEYRINLTKKRVIGIIVGLLKDRVSVDS